jgi:hypothetical protein
MPESSAHPLDGKLRICHAPCAYHVASSVGSRATPGAAGARLRIAIPIDRVRVERRVPWKDEAPAKAGSRALALGGGGEHTAAKTVNDVVACVVDRRPSPQSGSSQADASGNADKRYGYWCPQNASNGSGGAQYDSAAS